MKPRPTQQQRDAAVRDILQTLPKSTWTAPHLVKATRLLAPMTLSGQQAAQSLRRLGYRCVDGVWSDPYPGVDIDAAHGKARA